MTWWWLLGWGLLLVLAGLWLGSRAWMTYRRFRGLVAEVQRAGTVLGDLDAERERVRRPRS